MRILEGVQDLVGLGAREGESLHYLLEKRWDGVFAKVVEHKLTHGLRPLIRGSHRFSPHFPGKGSGTFKLLRTRSAAPPRHVTQASPNRDEPRDAGPRHHGPRGGRNREVRGEGWPGVRLHPE